MKLMEGKHTLYVRYPRRLTPAAAPGAVDHKPARQTVDKTEWIRPFNQQLNNRIWQHAHSDTLPAHQLKRDSVVVRMRGMGQRPEKPRRALWRGPALKVWGRHVSPVGGAAPVTLCRGNKFSEEKRRKGCIKTGAYEMVASFNSMHIFSDPTQTRFRFDCLFWIVCCTYWVIMK